MYLCYFLLEVVSSPQQGLKGRLVRQLHGLVWADGVHGWWLQVDYAGFVLRLCCLPWPRCQGLLVALGDRFHGHVSYHLSDISALVMFLSSGVCHTVHHRLTNDFT